MKKARDRYICRLNGIYEDGLDKLKVNAVFLSTNSGSKPQPLVSHLQLSHFCQYGVEESTDLAPHDKNLRM